MRKIIFIVLVLLTVAMILNGHGASAPILIHRYVTVAGELKVLQLDEKLLGDRFSVTLNNDIILKTDGDDESSRFNIFPVIQILRRISKKILPFDEVIVFQQKMWGNACSGGPIWFLGLKKNGSFEVSDAIDVCGGEDPIIKEGLDKITVIIAGYSPKYGRGYIPGETWVYKNGKVRKLRAPKK